MLVVFVATKIEFVGARQVLDSRGNPTVEAVVRTKLGTTLASTPSGASTGAHEALELRDGGSEYGGKGVKTAVANVNGPIAKKIVGMPAEDQAAVDNALITLDGTEGKTRLGANATTAVSLAVCRAGALANGVQLYEYVSSLYKPARAGVLPVPMLNVINGGKHASGGLACQELMIQPAGAKSYAEGLRESAEAYHALKKEIASLFGGVYTNVGDEGGFVPPLKSMDEAFGLLSAVLGKLDYGKDFVFAADPAATSFYKNGTYLLDGKELDPNALGDYYAALAAKYPLKSVEDGFQEEGFEEFANFTAKGKFQVVGDDLLVSNPRRIALAIEQKACNALLLKINQIGTVTEGMLAAKAAHDAGWAVVVSNRSGETEDSFIADFSVGIGCGQIKTGAPARGERTCKYNRLLQIEEELGARAKYFSPYS